MLIAGCDFHPGFQQVAIFDNQTGEIIEKKLHHPAKAIGFYRGLEGEVRVGLEAGSPCRQPASPIAGSSKWRIMVAVGDRIDGWWRQKTAT